MNTLDQVRALFQEGATIELVQSCSPELNGTHYRIDKAGKSYLECTPLDWPAGVPGGDQYRFDLPMRVCDVVWFDGCSLIYRQPRGTTVLRVVAWGAGLDLDTLGRVHSWGFYLAEHEPELWSEVDREALSAVKAAIHSLATQPSATQPEVECTCGKPVGTWHTKDCPAYSSTQPEEEQR